MDQDYVDAAAISGTQNSEAIKKNGKLKCFVVCLCKIRLCVMKKIA